MSAAVSRLLDKIGDNGATRSGDSWLVKCPGHDDNRRSLAIRAGEKGAILKCHAGCEAGHVVEAVGLTMSDLFDGPPPEREKSRIVARYPYRDEAGVLLYEAVRFDPKDFRARRPNGNGWTWNLGDVRRVLYRLPELIASSPRAVFVVEGEKDADALAALGLVATTNAGGAGKWHTTYNNVLSGRPVIVLPDNDAPGEKHAAQVAASLTGVASSVRVVRLPGLPPKGDVSDWIAAGGTRDKLAALVKAPAPGGDDEIRRLLGEVIDRVGEIGRLLSAKGVA